MKIAIVTSDIMGPIKNGGVGTSCYLLSKYLSDEHDVSVLFVSEVALNDPSFIYWKYFYQDLGVKLEAVQNPDFPLDQGHEHVARSMKVYLALEQSNYDMIIFPEMHGLGHYCIQAKKCGVAFQKTLLWVMFHGPTRWHLRFNAGLPTRFNDLSTDYIEKQSCLDADHLLFATEHSRSVALDMGYTKPTTPHTVLAFPFEGAQSKKPRSARKIKEVCFFGRLESRKGLHTFLNALEQVHPLLQSSQVKISFLGSVGYVDGRNAADFIHEWSHRTHIEIEIIGNKNREEAIDYLTKNEVLAVLPSQAETMGYTLIECLQNNIPFISSDIEPFSEMLGVFKAKNAKRFPVGESSALAKLLRECLRRPQAPLLIADSAAGTIRRKWCALIRSAKPAVKILGKSSSKKPTISVCIPHRGRSEYLSQLLEVISLSKVLPHEVVIYDDASAKKDLEAVQKLVRKKWRFPIRLLLGKKRLGPSGARNRLGQQATGEYLFFLDDDNLPVDSLISDLQTICSRNQPDIVVATMIKFDCPMSGQSSSHSERYWFPVGDDLSMNYFQNLIGDANSCVKKSFYLKVGGYDESLQFCEDQEFFVRSSIAGAKYIMCPKPLVYYRVHAANHSRKANLHENLIRFQNAIGKQLFNGELNYLMQLLTALIYRNESNVANGGWDVYRNHGRSQNVVSRPSKTQTKSLKEFKKVLANKTAATAETVKITTSATFRKAQPTRSRARSFEVCIVAPEPMLLQVNPSEEGIVLNPGPNRVLLKTPKGFPLSLVTQNKVQDLFITYAKPSN